MRLVALITGQITTVRSRLLSHLVGNLCMTAGTERLGILHTTKVTNLRAMRIVALLTFGKSKVCIIIRFVTAGTFCRATRCRGVGCMTLGAG